MLRDLETPQKVFFYILFALTGVAFALSVFAIYGFMNNAKPKTLGVSYANVLTTSSGEVPICEINIFSNKNNNGLELYEVRFNSYTDVEGSWVKGFGLQVPTCDWGAYLSTNTSSKHYLINLPTLSSFVYFKTSVQTKDLIVYGDWSFYQSDDLGANSYKFVGELSNNLYIDIEGEFYQIVLNSYKYQTWKTNWLGQKKYKDETGTYTWFELFRHIVDSCMHDNRALGDSTYYIDLLECSKYYHLLKQNDKGQYLPLDKVSDLRNYLQVKVNYHDDGITDASQSMFKQVKYSPTWSYWDGTGVEDFWSVVTPMHITEANITTIESNGKNYITINQDYVAYLKTLSNAEFYVNINLDNIDTEVSGILMDNFTMKTQEFNITSSTSQEFEILNPSSYNVPILNLGGA